MFYLTVFVMTCRPSESRKRSLTSTISECEGMTLAYHADRRTDNTMQTQRMFFESTDGSTHSCTFVLYFKVNDAELIKAP